ncbi:MAG: hypothetical protein AB7W47_00835 [Calditrichaceae bacterium]
MKNLKKVVIIAPYFNNDSHVGVYRIKRFIKWLKLKDYEIVLVSAGSSDNLLRHKDTIEITIKDPLGLNINSKDQKVSLNVKKRKPNALRRKIVYWLFTPDPTIVWSRRVMKSKLVLKYIADASFVLSSSPPESVHLAAAKLAKKIKASFIMDMRDGWIDEPLKPILKKSGIRNWLETKMEKKLLKQAKIIFVSSDNWRDSLLTRVKCTHKKVITLTNAYPEAYLHLFDSKTSKKISDKREKHITLLHAGKFTESRGTQKPELLLIPLLEGIKTENNLSGTLILMGYLNESDKKTIGAFSENFKKSGWSIEIWDSVPREKMMLLLKKADGLLLLSVSEAAIPSKLFEYLMAKKPILAVTPQNSSVWNICKPLPQISVIDSNFSKDDSLKNELIKYFYSCKNGCYNFIVPQEFTEGYLGQKYLRALSEISST